MSKDLTHILALKDFAVQSRRLLPRPIYGYIAGAAEDNNSLRNNADAMGDFDLVPRTLVNVSQRSQSQTLFGHTYSSPFGVAPMGLLALSGYRGDLAVTRAASNAGIAAVLSGSALVPLEEVIAQAPGTWFQAYLPGDVQRIMALLLRVRNAGYQTLVVTVDIPVAANRENNVRNGFSTPLRPNFRLAWDGICHPRWMLGTLVQTIARHGMPHFENSFAERGAPILSKNVLRDFSHRDHLDWSSIASIRAFWKGNLVIKGILSPQDAVKAQEMGADGIIVSNHGGRQLDGAVAPMRVLSQIVDSASKIPVMVDGGFHRGSEVLKALAIGARMVFVGRPFNHAVAVGGQAGVAHAIKLLKAEVDRNMAMLGVGDFSQLDRSYLMNRRGRL